MIDHLELTTENDDAMCAFYSEALRPLGYVKSFTTFVCLHRAKVGLSGNFIVRTGADHFWFRRSCGTAYRYARPGSSPAPSMQSCRKIATPRSPVHSE
jgi:hypothetical protein